jgi:hypothetical protein
MVPVAPAAGMPKGCRVRYSLCCTVPEAPEFLGPAAKGGGYMVSVQILLCAACSQLISPGPKGLVSWKGGKGRWESMGASEGGKFLVGLMVGTSWFQGWGAADWCVVCMSRSYSTHLRCGSLGQEITAIRWGVR